MGWKNAVRRFLGAAFIVVMGCSGSATLSAQGDANDWLSWRGNAGSGVAPADHGGLELPTQWSHNSKSVRWKTPIRGKGLSSPIVAGSRVFVTTAYDAAGSRLLLDGIGVALALFTAAFGLLASRRSHGLGRPRFRKVSWRSPWAWSATLGVGVGWSVSILAFVATLTNHFEWMERRVLGLPLRSQVLLILGTACAITWSWIVFGRGVRGKRAWLPPALTLGACATMLLGLPTRYAFILAALLGFGAMAIMYGRVQSSGDSSKRRLTAELDVAFLATAGVLTIVFVVGAALRPEWFWAESIAQHVWCRAAMVASLASVAAVGAWPGGMKSRRAGAAILVPLAIALFVWMPGNEVGIAPPVGRRFVSILPMLLGLPWLFFVPATWPAPERHAARRGVAVAASLCVIGLGAWTFLRANVFQPRLRTEQALVCIDRETGSTLWTKVLFETTAEYLDTFRTSHATPTPASDGSRVVAYFGTGLACLDFDGNVLWRRSYPEYLAHSTYGAGSSPVIAGDRVILTQESECDHESKPSFIAAYDLATGKELWLVHPTGSRSSYGTPLLRPPDAPTEFLVATWQAVVSYDLESGAQRWSLPLRIEEIATSLVTDDACVFVAGGSIAGLTAAVSMPSPDCSEPTRLWQTRRARPTCCSPVLHDGRLFTVTDAGILSAMRATDGKVLWRKRLAMGDYYASLFVGDGNLYVSNAEGRTTVVRAADDFEIVSENDLGERILTSPAAAGGQLFLRGEQRVYCLERSSDPLLECR